MANFNFNKAILGGRLTADPELKTTPSGLHVTSFKMAVNRRNSSKDGGDALVDFIDCVAWRQTAEFITCYFRKGSSICVIGPIRTRSWNDAQGAKRYTTEVVVEEATFVDSKGEVVISGTENQPGPAFEEITDDSERMGFPETSEASFGGSELPF